MIDSETLDLGCKVYLRLVTRMEELGVSLEEPDKWHDPGSEKLLIAVLEEFTDPELAAMKGAKEFFKLLSTTALL